MENTITENMLMSAISNADQVQIDASWAILKYKEIGIYRKVACLSSLFNLNFELIKNELPKDEDGRLLDFKTRHMIHDSLLSVS
jgi:hypothetical protein